MRFLFWFLLALSILATYTYFNGADRGLQLTTGYFLELTLSIDNLVIMYLIMTRLKIAERDQSRILFYGILFAVIARVGFIFFGLEILHHFKWAQYLFAIILLASAMQLLREWCSHSTPEIMATESRLMKFLESHLRFDANYKGPHFFSRVNGQLFVTSGLIALILIEISDLIFAVDSVPAVLSVTREPQIAILANILAIFGLRSLYGVIVHFVERWRFLKPALVVIMIFVAAKLALAEVYEISSIVSLGVVIGVILLSIIAYRVYRKPAAK